MSYAKVFSDDVKRKWLFSFKVSEFCVSAPFGSNVMASGYLKMNTEKVKNKNLWSYQELSELRQSFLTIMSRENSPPSMSVNCVDRSGQKFWALAT